MSKFVVILKDRKEGELSTELLKQHVEHLRRLSVLNKLFICGPYRTSASAIQILEAGSLSEAESLIKSDPFIDQKYYRSYTIDELIEANEANNFLLSTTEEKIRSRES